MFTENVQPSDPSGRQAAAAPRVSVVIATRDRGGMLRTCLESIHGCTPAAHEVIVVDSASRDAGANERVAAAFGAGLLRTEVPGAGHARNLGARAATGEIVAFTDDDAVVDPGWIGAMANAFRDSEVDAAVGPVFVQGAQPPAVMGVRPGIDPSKDEVRFSRAEPDWFERLAFGAIGYGANLAARASSFRGKDLFRCGLGTGAPIPGDENYFLFGVVAKDGVVMNVPQAKVFHPPQSPERTRDIQKGAVAYLLLLAATHPSLLPQFAARLFRRAARPLGTGASATDGTTAGRHGFVQAATEAPRALVEAWRHERRVVASCRAQGTAD